MARYTGPRLRKLRSLDIVELPGLTRKVVDRRPYPPGQHGSARARVRKLSDFKKQLVERQKLRFHYGVTEGQLRRIVGEARRAKGRPDENVIILLERRLDSVVFRSGLAPTIPAARQLIVHGHLLVDGRKVDRPGFRVRQGTRIAVRQRSREIASIRDSWAKPSLERPEWLEVDEEAMTAAVKIVPDAQSVPFQVQVSLVLEHYAARV